MIALVGFGRFARAFAGLAMHHGATVRAIDPIAENVPEELRAASMRELVAGAIEIVIAVPVPVLESVLAELAPLVTPAHLVMDVGSVKVKPVAAMDAALGDRAAWIGTHPLFGPASLAAAERPMRVVVCPNPRHPTAASRARAFYAALGCEVHEQTAEEHDKLMARTHALAFFVAKGVLDAQSTLSKDPPAFAPPSFQGLARTIETVRADAGHLFRVIEQENPFAADARQALLEALVKTDRALAASTSAEHLTIPPEHLPPGNDAASLLRDTRASIDALDHQLVQLLAQRTELSTRAREAKDAIGMGVLDAQREARLVAARRAWAEEMELDADAVDDVFQSILRLSRAVQRKR